MAKKTKRTTASRTQNTKKYVTSKEFMYHNKAVKKALCDTSTDLGEELKKYKHTIQTATEKNTEEIKAIHTLLSEVSANGTKGLQNSLRDIYQKIDELTELTKSARTNVAFMRAFSEWRAVKPWRGALFSKKSYVGFIMLFFTLHKLQIGSQSILNIIVKFFVE